MLAWDTPSLWIWSQQCKTTFFFKHQPSSLCRTDFFSLHSFQVPSLPRSVVHLCNQMVVNLEVMIACIKRWLYSLCTEFRTKNMILFVQGLFYSTPIWMLYKVMETPFKWVPNCIYTCVCVSSVWGLLTSLMLSQCSIVFPMWRMEDCIFKVTDL